MNIEKFHCQMLAMYWTHIILGFILLSIIHLVYKAYRFCSEQNSSLYYNNEKRLDGKTALITGANSGIGYATALDFASRGARVLLACRNLSKAVKAAESIIKETGNENLRTIQLKLSDLESVRRLARQVVRNEQRLDILVNNAGTSFSEEPTTRQSFDYIFGVNYLGSFLLTYLLLDLLKKSAPSRIINVSSFVHHYIKKKPKLNRGSETNKVKYPDLSGYHMSKLCNILHAKALTNRLFGTGVTANSMNPGFVATNILNKSNPSRTLKFMSFFLSMTGRSAKDAAKTIVYMTLEDSLSEVSGHYFQNVGLIAPDKLSPLTKDKEFIFDLWDVSMKMCQE
ncbi:retinol dehydrogenase 13 [Octopus bimaculoides]|uniref:Uncharacterized protein n=1 Tax=Octopus bimaculoides TaxID=37653 RepID=A0A0L8GRG2_OCTBM|nr:retinol dehydrogenase 13 [Octopus bimaculoides]|eukprot:XP_014778995.1 PREDICTED: retinol dehydrogenase 13-like [Octopus bimaculoides]